MTTRLLTVRPDMRPSEAARLLVKKNVGGAPVVDDEGRYLGVFSEETSMVALVDAVHDQIPTIPTVRAYLDTDTPTITEDTGFLSIAQLFLERSIHRLPVLRDGRLVGQISRRDLIRSILKALEPIPSREAQLLYLSALRSMDDDPLDKT